MPQKSNSVKVIVLIVIVLAIVGGLIYWKQTSEKAPQIQPQNGTAKENNIININNFSFNPEELVVSPGTTVIWKHNDSASHDVVSNIGLFKSPTMVRGDQFSFVFEKIGEYTYYCGIHPSMNGKIIVK